MIRKFALSLSLVALVLGLWSCAGGDEGSTPFRENPTARSAPVPAPTTVMPASEELLVMERPGFEAGRFAPEVEQDPRDRHRMRYAPSRSGEAPHPGVVAPRGGELRTKVADREVPLPLKHTDVKGRLTVNLASVTLTQQYHNPYDSKIEAVYVFPMPEDAAVRDFVLVIGERRIRGIIREREEAKQIYLEARRQGHVASLLTQERPNIFTQAVANIEPGKQIDIAITYFHSLRYQKGTFEFHVPMVVGPRYNPPGSKDGVGAVANGQTGASGQKTEVQYLAPTELSRHDVSLSVDIEAGAPLAGLECPSHVVDIERPAPDRARVTLHPNDRIPNKDFVLRYTVAGAGVRPSLALHRDGEEGYFTLLVHPPAELSEVPRSPREMIFVLDCSGSMHGEPLALAKRVMNRALRRLSPDDTFQVICFSDRASTWGPNPVPATPENVARGVRFVDGLQSEGGTNMIEGIKAALDFPHAEGRFRIVSFVTDGYIGNDQEILGEIRRRLGPARIFSFGIGSSVNRYLIEHMGREGRGVATIVTLNESGEKAVDTLYERIEKPALSDLKIDWGTLGVSEVHPSPLPDLFVGRPVILSGRFKGHGKTELTLRGKAGGRELTFTLAVDPERPGETNPAIASVWARNKIASLHLGLAGSADSRELVDEIRRTALKHGLMCEFTAFVAVDSASKTAGASGTTVVQPVPVPAGVKYETTVEKR